MEATYIAGPIRLVNSNEKAWVALNTSEYDGYWVNSDNEINGTTLRAQWLRTGGIVATVDVYVRVMDERCELVRRVHFYDPDEAWYQADEKYKTISTVTASKETYVQAVQSRQHVLDQVTLADLDEWWSEITESR